MMNGKSLRLFGILGCLALAVLVAGCGPNGKTNRGFPGYLKADLVYIAPPAAGRLETLSVHKGQTVKKGDPLFALDRNGANDRLRMARELAKALGSIAVDMEKGRRPDEIDALKARVEAMGYLVEGSETGVERETEMYAKNAVSFKQYNIVKHLHLVFTALKAEAEADLKQAALGERPDRVAAVKAAIQAASALIDELEWRSDQLAQAAPCDALVFDTYYYVGEQIGADRPVVALLPPENVRVRFYAPAPVVNRLKIGGEIHFTVSGQSKPMKATIDYVAAKAEYTPPMIFSEELDERLVYQVEAALNPELAARLRAGHPVTVTINGN